MPAIGELFRATISLEGDGGLNQNVLHFRGDNGVETAQDLVDVLVGSYWPALQDGLSNATRCLGISAQQLTPIVRDPAFGVPVSPLGDLSGTEINSQLAVILTLRTGFSSRRKRGRMYIGPVIASSADNNTLNVAGTAIYNTFKNEILTNFNDDTGIAPFSLGVYSRLDGGDGPVYSTAGWTAVTQIDVQPVLGTQRRRRLGRGA